MKEPKYLPRIAGRQFVVPESSGIATVIKMMEDAVPVNANLAKREIELIYTDEGEDQYRSMLEYLRTVTIRKIPAGVKWTRKTPAGSVEVVQIVRKPAGTLKNRASERPALKGRHSQPARLGHGSKAPLQLEFGT